MSAELQVELADVEATWRVGALLGGVLRDGDVIQAEGDLGAGKTSLAQGIARGLGVPKTHYVNSPTFAILQSHPGRVTFHHIDLYRLGDPDEALGLGLDEIVGVDGVAYVEWPSRVPELIPDDALIVNLTLVDSGRRLVVRAQGARGRAIVAAFADAHARDLGENPAPTHQNP